VLCQKRTTHPVLADEDGYVSFPNVNVVEEIVNLYSASREYYLAERLLEQCLPGSFVPDSIQMLMWNAEHFQVIEEIRDRLDRIERKLDALKPAK
jgi:hypothetical protein